MGGTGAPLLLIHGTGLTWRSWLPVLPDLERERRVFVVDLPGFGDSAPIRTPSIAGMADALEAHLDFLGVGNLAVAGNSLGGWLALELAARGRAESVVAISPAGAWTARERQWTRAIVGRLGRMHRPPDRAFARPRLRRALMLPGMVHGERISPAEAVRYARAYGGTPGFESTVRDTFNEVFTDYDRVACPVLVLFGARDYVVIRRAGPRLARLIPGARFELLPGCGHVPMVDDPDGIARRILATTC